MHEEESKWTDWLTLRFCRARKFDVEKIKIMLTNYLKWYKENNVGQIGQLDMKKYE